MLELMQDFKEREEEREISKEKKVRRGKREKSKENRKNVEIEAVLSFGRRENRTKRKSRRAGGGEGERNKCFTR